jgi:hypothetical protein
MQGITHTGGATTGLTISSTNGHVTVEGNKFSGSNLVTTGRFDLDVSGGNNRSKSRENNAKKCQQLPDDYVNKLEQMLDKIKHDKRNNNKSMIFALKEYNYQSERRRMERMANFDEYEKYQAENSINDISNCKDDENESLVNINDERSDDSYIQGNHFGVAADGSRRISSYCCCVSTFWNLKRYIQYTLVPDIHRHFESDI